MPQVATKPNGVSAPVRKTKEKPVVFDNPKADVEREVLYPEVRLQICAVGYGVDGGDASITVDLAKQLIGWETEKEYSARMMSENPDLGLKEENCKLKDDDWLLSDEAGNKIACWNNSKNRPFRESHAKKLAQDILNKKWRLNLENIIISLTGQVTSGQHRLIALILAGQAWAGKNSARWAKNWPTEPTIETLVAFGGSEELEVLQTLDNVLARTEADVFYMSPLFEDLDKSQRKECARMCAKATDLLWKRTHVSSTGGTEQYKTHSAAMGFVERHPRLLDCIRNLFDLNEGRVITNLKLSPGECAGMLYLMGSFASDGDEYIGEERPSEKKLNWNNWDRACEFWGTLVKTWATADSSPIKNALGNLVDADTLAGGRSTEKLAVIAKAWAIFREGQEFTEEDLKLEYTRNPETGVETLTDKVNFGGIDFGEPEKKGGKPQKDPDKEAIEQAKVAERQRRVDETLAKVKEIRAAKEAKAAKEKAGKSTRKQVEAAQTERARQADKEKLRGGIGS